jgi:hypothetical protein
VRATARLLRMAGRSAEQFHDQRVRGVTPRALEFEEQWRCVKKSRSGAMRTRWMRLATCGTIRQLLRIASWWSLWWWANGRKRRPIHLGAFPGLGKRLPAPVLNAGGHLIHQP